MKTFLISFSTFLLTLLVVPLALAQSSDLKQTYQEGLAAYQAQNWKVAVEKFTEVLRRTGNPRVRFYLRNAQLKLAEGEPSVSLEKKLSQVIIPSIEFEETPVPVALEYLRAKTVELTEGEIRPNFIYKADRNAPSPPTVTLRLSSIPVSEVIRYIGDLSRTRFRYEAHAVVGMPMHLEVPEPEE